MLYLIEKGTFLYFKIHFATVFRFLGYLLSKDFKSVLVKISSQFHKFSTDFVLLNFWGLNHFKRS